MLNELNTFWAAAMNGALPVAHELREQFHERWVRFHSLPESKRYPESEAEYEEVFSRHNAILSHLYDLPTEVLTILPEYSELQQRCLPHDAVRDLFPETIPWCSYPANENDGLHVHLHVARVQYSGTELDGLLRRVADDQVRNVLIINLPSQSVVHPYDGGADVILPTSEARDQLKHTFRDWLPSHPQGL